MTVAELLRSSGLDALDARVIVGHALGVSRAWLTAHSHDSLDATALTGVQALLERRRQGEPVAYLVGEREFHGLMIQVSPAVLIPRPETELLVETALRELRTRQRVIDLGTGSGAIAIALAHARPDLEVWATDASESALALARENASRLGARVTFAHGDWFAEVEGDFDAVLSNPPYIAATDPHLGQGDLRFEPRAALVAGTTGLECLDAIGRLARARLRPNGLLLLEHGYDQGDAAVALLRSLGYRDVEDHHDLAGQPRLAQARFDPEKADR
jgi:release factor glutamine methyltransferase